MDIFSPDAGVDPTELKRYLTHDSQVDEIDDPNSLSSEPRTGLRDTMRSPLQAKHMNAQLPNGGQAAIRVCRSGDDPAMQSVSWPTPNGKSEWGPKVDEELCDLLSMTSIDSLSIRRHDGQQADVQKNFMAFYALRSMSASDVLIVHGEKDGGKGAK
mmetsp:Transcript_36626/g.51050  ORF Transcript_36626/g.51050 Transcript_36626/m.51050 type:complete len:157 (+) Transcript_36626:90-560(+)